MRILSATLLASIVLVPLTALAEDTVSVEFHEGTERIVNEVNRSLLRVQDHPCTGMRSIERQFCIIQRGKGQPAVRVFEHATDRRRGALTQRALEQRGHLVPLGTLKPTRIDLRPTSERQAERRERVRSILEKQQQGTLPEGAAPQPLLRARTEAAGREDAGSTTAPLCSRRHGIELLHCLELQGVEISPLTVDPPTWEIYQGIQGENTQE